MNARPDTHSKVIGDLLWLFGFTGSHRFYMGKWVTGLLYLFTLGLFGIGWLSDYWTLNAQISERNHAKSMA